MAIHQPHYSIFKQCDTLALLCLVDLKYHSSAQSALETIGKVKKWQFSYLSIAIKFVVCLLEFCVSIFKVATWVQSSFLVNYVVSNSQQLHNMHFTMYQYSQTLPTSKKEGPGIHCF